MYTYSTLHQNALSNLHCHSRKVGTDDMKLIWLKSGFRVFPQLGVLLLEDGRAALFLGRSHLSQAFPNPFYAIGRAVWYFQEEMIIAEGFGNLTISKINADLSGPVPLCCTRGITDRYGFL